MHAIMDSTPEESAEGLAIVQVLSAVLDRLVSANAPIARADPGAITKFHAMKAPGISVSQYLERIHKYASCSNQCFILALVYIDRLIQMNNFLLTDLNVHRVVITAILLAAKFFDDAYYNNAYYAKVGGVMVSEINGLEVDFLFRINFSLHVTPEEFDKYRNELLLHAVVTPIPETYPYAPVQISPEVTPTADPLLDLVYPTNNSNNMIMDDVSSSTSSQQFSHQLYHPQQPPPQQQQQQVTPSPPHVVEVENGLTSQHQPHSMLEIPSFHRSQSMPPLMPKPCPQLYACIPTTIPLASRCVQQQPLLMPRDPMTMMMAPMIHPIQGTIVHHNHGGNTVSPRSKRVLAGVMGL